jgi:streptogramin lyase
MGSFQTIGKLNPGIPDVKHNYVPVLNADPFGWFINTTASGQTEIERLTPQGLGGVHAAEANRSFIQVVTAPDGSAGFVETGRVPEIVNGTFFGWADQSWVGRATLSGTFTEIAMSVSSMVAGPDDSFWFLSSSTALDPSGTVQEFWAIAKLDPSGTIHEFPLSAGRYPGSLTVGPDGNLWFTESLGAKVPPQLNLPVYTVNGVPEIPPSPAGYMLARMTSNGQITELPIAGLPAQSDNGIVGFYHIAALADGNFWYATPTSNTVTRLALDGTATTFALPDFTYPDKVVLGPDGNYWIEESEGVGRLTPAGVVTQFSVSLGRLEHITNMFVGPDNNLWFQRGTAAERVTMKGVSSVVVLSRKRGDGGIQKILRGPDGGVWVLAEKNGAFGPLRLRSLRRIPPTAR